MRIPRISRKPWSAALVAVAVTALGSAGLAVAAAGPAAAAGSAFPAHYAAPYLQIASSDAGDMAADMAATGDKYYTLAFLVSAVRLHSRLGGRRLQLGRLQLADQRHSGRRRQRHHLVRRCGCQRELAQTCTNVSQLTAAYQNMVNTTVHPAGLRHRGLRRWRTPSATSLRDQALAALQAAGSGRAGRLHPRASPRRGCPPATAPSTRCSRTPRPRA